MSQALDLARTGIALCSPNPCVGALLVDSTETIVGRGSYRYDGLTHAEVLAIREAGERARGATLYINLEPCSHHGRTPPCADAVIKAGIARVIASIADPNPLVSGKGFEKLRAAGIAVETGLMETEAHKLNEAFAKYIRHRTPFVTLKSAMSLDGKIAPARTKPVGERTPADWITGDAARQHVQQLRHASDAILTGIGTILADDPSLTDRTGLPRRRPLLRVILDSHLRLPLDSQMVKSAADDVLVFYVSSDEGKRQELQARGVRLEALSADRRPIFGAVVRRLGELEITSLLIEGGSAINTAALSSGIVDKVFFFYAPKFLGSDALAFVGNLSSSATMVPGVSLGPRGATLHRFADEFAVEGYLRDPYGE